MNPATPTPPHIFTLTGNLLAERTLEFGQWSPGRTQRATRQSFQVGGKGINVSKMLGRLGLPSTALCFVGGAPGTECEAWLHGRDFAFRAFPTRAPTRVGSVVRDASGLHGETTFLGPDVPPDANAIRACAEFLNAQPPGQVLAVCGSFPGWKDPDFTPLHLALARWIEGGSLVVDAYGPPLNQLVQWPLALLKINADELRPLYPNGLGEIPRRVQRVVITDGPREVHLRDSDGVTATLTPAATHEVSATGSGDVLLACVLAALYARNLSLEEAVAFALPYAAANAAHPGIAEFPLPGAGSCVPPRIELRSNSSPAQPAKASE